jgi:protein-tyrosine phosphatase
MDLAAHDPLVPLEGALNFRDLGGYAAADGGRLRAGQVYRADGLATLTDGDLERLRALGLRTVIDFRRTDERDEAPTIVWDHGMELLHLGVDAAGDERQDFMAQVLAGTMTGDPVDEMVDIYGSILEDFADRFAVLFEHLARDERRPAVFHCTAGKDRTGIAAMLVLAAVGVDRDTIVHDYGLTHRYRTVKRIPVLEPTLAEAGLTVERVLPFIGAVPEVMERTIDHVEQTYGGVRSYLRDRAGVPDTTVEAVRSALVVDDR